MAADWVFWPALATLLALLLYFCIGLAVGQARATYGVPAPATTGHDGFERLYRVQVNTLEWMPLFLPTLWLFAFYVDGVAAFVIGLVWIAGRWLYWQGYAKAADKRGPGFGIQALAVLVLFLGALGGAILDQFQIRLF